MWQITEIGFITKIKTEITINESYIDLFVLFLNYLVEYVFFNLH